MAVIASDSSHDWGARTVIDGALVQLQFFQCNPDSLFSAMLGTEYNCSIDRATGVVLFNVPSYIPTRSMKKPGLATHFRLITSAAELDFNANTRIMAANEIGLMQADLPGFLFPQYFFQLLTQIPLPQFRRNNLPRRVQ